MHRIVKIASVTALALSLSTVAWAQDDMTGLSNITGPNDIPGPNNIPGLSNIPGLGGLLGSGGGQGQIVHDPLNYVEIGLMLKELIQSYEVLKEQYQELQYTVASLQHLNPQSLETAAGLLNNGMRLPGSAPAQMPGYNYGSTLSGYGQQFYNQNHVYAPEGDDWTAQEMQRRQYATANLQGEAQAGLERATERLASLTELENSILAQPDVQAVSAMNARINAEHMYLANEQANLQRLTLLQETQARVDQQRAEQHGRQEADQWDAAVAGQAWGN